MDDELRQRLRDAAEAHRPTGPGCWPGSNAGWHRSRRRVPRCTEAVGALAAGGGRDGRGVRSAGGRGGRCHFGGAGRGEDRRPAASTAPASPPAVRGGALPAEDGPLWTDGSVDAHSNAYWAQSNVTFKARQPLAALTVELRIALTGEVVTTGSWRSLPEEDFVASAQEEGGFLVYRWSMKPGRTAPRARTPSRASTTMRRATGTPGTTTTRCARVRAANRRRRAATSPSGADFSVFSVGR
ncbi:hypothetical protein NKH18_10435 [Streptomyces sp. M10(2022)]